MGVFLEEGIEEISKEPVTWLFFVAYVREIGVPHRKKVWHTACRPTTCIGPHRRPLSEERGALFSVYVF